MFISRIEENTEYRVVFSRKKKISVVAHQFTISKKSKARCNFMGRKVKGKI